MLREFEAVCGQQSLQVLEAGFVLARQHDGAVEHQRIPSVTELCHMEATRPKTCCKFCDLSYTSLVSNMSWALLINLLSSSKTFTTPAGTKHAQTLVQIPHS